MANLILSTIAFFGASYYSKRYLDDAGIPKGMTRSILVFCIAAAVSFAVSWLVETIGG